MNIDDIKQFANNEKELENLIQIIRIYSQDIRMEFGIKMCHKETNNERNRTTKPRKH